MNKDGIRKVISRAGGAAKLAANLGITRQAVYSWHRIPSDHVIKIEQVSGVSRQKLRPDLYPD